jgi:hypothetical protein
MNLPYAVQYSWLVLISSGQSLLRLSFLAQCFPLFTPKVNLRIARYFSLIITFTKQLLANAFCTLDKYVLLRKSCQVG